MISSGADWYKKIWSLDIQDQSWVENTRHEVDFLIENLRLTGNEKILDLACGFGRHSLELARRGFSVTGVDITADYIEYAKQQAAAENLAARFTLCDIRDVDFCGEFDIVLNMADGAVGYLENDSENLKIFDVVSRALKRGGKHFMDVINAEYAEGHFPCRLWAPGLNGLTLSQFEWNEKTRIMLYGQLDFEYGSTLTKPLIEYGNPTRLYSLGEIEQIMLCRNMKVKSTWSDYYGNPSGENAIQLMVLSEKP